MNNTRVWRLGIFYIAYITDMVCIVLRLIEILGWIHYYPPRLPTKTSEPHKRCIVVHWTWLRLHFFDDITSLVFFFFFTILIQCTVVWAYFPMDQIFYWWNYGTHNLVLHESFLHGLFADNLAWIFLAKLGCEPQPVDSKPSAHKVLLFSFFFLWHTFS